MSHRNRDAILNPFSLNRHFRNSIHQSLLYTQRSVNHCSTEFHYYHPRIVPKNTTTHEGIVLLVAAVEIFVVIWQSNCWKHPLFSLILLRLLVLDRSISMQCSCLMLQWNAEWQLQPQETSISLEPGNTYLTYILGQLLKILFLFLLLNPLYLTLQKLVRILRNEIWIPHSWGLTLRSSGIWCLVVYCDIPEDHKLNLTNISLRQ